MKHRPCIGFFVATALALGACQTSPYSPASDAKPVPPSLADRLPADTVAYFTLPDIQTMRADMQKSALARMLQEPDMQNFLGGILGMLDEAWAELRTQAASEGVPAELLHWDALRSFEAGFAIRQDPTAVRVFDRPPHAHAIARLGVADGLGPLVFDLIAARVVAPSEIVRGPGGNSAVLMEDSEEGVPMRAVLTCDDASVEIEFLMGERAAGTLAGTEHYRRAWNRGMSAGAACFGFLRLDQVLDTVMRGVEGEQPDIAAIVRPFFDQCLAPMQSVSFASGWSDEGSFLNAMLDLAEGAGPPWGAIPADRSLAEYVPDNASAFRILTADTDTWMLAMLGLLDRAAAAQPEGMPVPLGQMFAQQAPELHAWLLGSHRAELQSAMLGFGNRAFTYTVPTSSLGSESLSFAELDDAAALASVLEQLMPRLRQVVNDSDLPFTIEMRRVKRETVQPDGSVTTVAGPAYYWLEFEIPEEIQQVLAMIQFEFQPAIGVAPEGWLVSSISKNSVASVLRSGMHKPERSILANESAAAFLARLPKEATAASWSDPRPATAEILGMLGGMLPMLGGMIGGELPVPLDLNAFPPAETFVRNMRTSESWSFTVRGDYMARSVGTMNLADVFTVLAGAVAIAPPMVMAVAPVLQGMDGDFGGTEVEF